MHFLHSKLLAVFILAVPTLANAAPGARLPASQERTQVIAVKVDPAKAGFRACKQKCQRKYFCRGKGPEKDACIAKRQACVAKCK